MLTAMQLFIIFTLQLKLRFYKFFGTAMLILKINHNTHAGM